MEHPHGVQPWGNLLCGGAKDIRNTGLGLLASLPDETLVAIFSALDARDLARAAAASRAAYCVAYHEELWRQLTLEQYQGDWEFEGSWQGTYKARAGLLTPSACPLLPRQQLRPGQQQQGRRQGMAAADATGGDRSGADGTAPGGDRLSSRGGGAAPTGGAAAAAGVAGGGEQAAAPAFKGWALEEPAVAVVSAGGPPAASQGVKARGRRGAKGGAKGRPKGCSTMARRPVGRAEPPPDVGCMVPAPVRGVRGFYSDLLYQPWHCATVSLQPDWLEHESIERRSGLTLQQFWDEYEVPNRPVIITDVVTQWPAMRKWTPEYIGQQYGDNPAIVGGYDMRMSSYMKYFDLAGAEEMPLYLFDKGFAIKAPGLAHDYTVPEFFREDLFSLLGEQDRPDYRWLIAGPARSGSSFHKDPNSTSAWNGVVAGAKRWVMFPPHVTPPGVHPSDDGADVAAPISLVEWYLNFYQAAREMDPPPLECTLRAGELLFVPHGWWHMAINLEPSVAVTQNYVSAVTLPHVAAFLSTRSEELVSGCGLGQRSGLFDRFMASLREHRPDLAASLAERQKRHESKLKKAAALAALFCGSNGSSGGNHSIGGGGGKATTSSGNRAICCTSNGTGGSHIIAGAACNGTGSGGAGGSKRQRTGGSGAEGAAAAADAGRMPGQLTAQAGAGSGIGDATATVACNKPGGGFTFNFSF